MIPKDRVLDKLDSLLQSNDYAGAKRMLQYWLSEAEYTGDSSGVLLMQNELMQKYSERITSRLFGEFRILPFLGTDIRLQKLRK